MRASGARSAAVELTTPCTTTCRDTTTPEYRSPRRPPLPPFRPAPLRPPPPTQMSTGSDKARRRETYGRRRGSRYQLFEDERSASSYPSEGMVDDTLDPHDDTDNDALPLLEKRDGVAPPPTTHPPGAGSLLLEELEPSGPAHRDHDEGSPSNRSSHPPDPAPHVPGCPH